MEPGQHPEPGERPIVFGHGNRRLQYIDRHRAGTLDVPADKPIERDGGFLNV